MNLNNNYKRTQVVFITLGLGDQLFSDSSTGKWIGDAWRQQAEGLISATIQNQARLLAPFLAPVQILSEHNE